MNKRRRYLAKRRRREARAVQHSVQLFNQAYIDLRYRRQFAERAVHRVSFRWPSS